MKNINLANNNPVEEMNKRKEEISNLKGINDYTKIVLKNFESRISILEEQTQKYYKNI